MSGIDMSELVREYQKMAGSVESAESGGKQPSFLDNFVMMPENEGVLDIRILPAAPGNTLPLFDGRLCMRTRIHTINGRKIHCPKYWVDGQKYPVGECKICEHYNWLYRKRDEFMREGDVEQAEAKTREARMIKPVERYYFNVIQRKLHKENGEEVTNAGPLILSVGKTLFERIMRAMLGDPKLGDEPLGDITDLKEGRDLRIVKVIRQVGADRFPNYDQSKFRNPSPAGTPEEMERWIGSLHDLKSLRMVKNAEEVADELRIHLGAKSDRRRPSYDPSEFLNSGADYRPDPGFSEVRAEFTPEPERSVSVDKEAFLSMLNN